MVFYPSASICGTLSIMETAADDDRLDRLESRAEITRLVHEYCHGADTRDLRRFLGVWHPDARWESAGSSVTGVDAILEAIEAQWARLPETRHLSANLVIDLDGDRATGQSAVLIAVAFPDGARARYTRTYDDVYERREGQWRIATRVAGESRAIDGPIEAFGA